MSVIDIRSRRVLVQDEPDPEPEVEDEEFNPAEDRPESADLYSLVLELLSATSAEEYDEVRQQLVDRLGYKTAGGDGA